MPASNGTFSVCVVWASELRAASLALKELHEAGKDATDAHFKAALSASYTAMRGCHDKPNIIVCEGERSVLEPRVTVVERPKTKEAANAAKVDT